MTALGASRRLFFDKMSSPPRRAVVASGRRPSAELRTIRMIVEEDPAPEVSYLDQDEFLERKTEYERGDFQLIRIYAEAEVVIESTTQVLKSHGLPGVESDADEDELADIYAEEWRSLRAVLKTVGVPTSELPVEVDPAWVERRT